MDVRDRHRLAMTRRVLSQLRSVDFRSHLRECTHGDPLPIIVVLPDDEVTYLFDQLDEHDPDQAVVVAADEGGWSTLAVEKSRQGNACATDLELVPGSTIDMLISYVKLQRGRSVTCTFIRAGLTLELLDESCGQLLG